MDMKVNDYGFNFDGTKDELEAYFSIRSKYTRDRDGTIEARKKEEEDIFSHVPTSQPIEPPPTKAPPIKVSKQPAVATKKRWCDMDKQERDEHRKNRTKEKQPGETHPDREQNTTILQEKPEAPHTTKLQVLQKKTEEPGQIWELAFKEAPEVRKIYDMPAKKRSEAQTKKLRRAWQNARNHIIAGPKEKEEPEPEEEQEEEETNKPNVEHAVQQSTGHTLKQMCQRFRYENSETGDALARKISQSLQIEHTGMRLIESVDILLAVKSTLKEIEEEEKQAKN